MRERDRPLEALVADRRDLQFHGAVLHQRHLGLDDLDVERHGLRHGHRQAVAAIVPDLAVVVAADEHRLLQQPALDRAIAFFVPARHVRPATPASVRVGRGGKQDRRRALVARDRAGFARQPSPAALSFPDSTSPPKSSRWALSISANAVALGHRRDDVEELRPFRQADRQPRLDRRDLDAIDEVRPAAAHLVRYADDIAIVFRGGEARRSCPARRCRRCR